MDLAEKWSFTKEKTYSNSSGSKDAVVEFIVQSQVTTSYGHKCYEGCRNKGIVMYCMLMINDCILCIYNSLNILFLLV